jgi:hypothetical protein
MENIFLGIVGKSSMGGDIGAEKGDFPWTTRGRKFRPC